MSKDTFYFSHDYNARNDEKIISLRMKLGWEGYGLYWAIIEKLRESKDYKLSLDFNLIAFDLRTDNQKVKSIVTGFDLFTIDEEDGKFYSVSLLSRMLIKESKSLKAKEAANSRWSKKKEVNADAMQTHSERNTDAMQGKESKVKESKVKEKEVIRAKRFEPPTIETLESYFLEKTNDVEFSKKHSKKFFYHYDAKGWLIGKNKMKNWKSSVTGWINRQEDFEKEKNTSVKKEKITAATALENAIYGDSGN